MTRVNAFRSTCAVLSLLCLPAAVRPEQGPLEGAAKAPLDDDQKRLTAKQRERRNRRLLERPSPDGKWLLLQQHDGFIVMPKDRSRTIKRKISEKEFWATCSNVLWMPDSRQWVCLMAGKKSIYAVVLSRQKKGILRKLPIGYPRGTITMWDLMGSRLLGFIKPNRVLALPLRDPPLNEGKPRKVPFYEFSTGEGKPQVREFLITLPKEAQEPREVALSPQGNQLAWLLYLAPSDEAKVNEVQLVVSRPDGTAMRVVGSFKIAGATSFYDLPRQLTWLPEGKRVSFVYKKVRWTVPLK